MNEYKTPKVTLISYTQMPLETVYSVWEASKGESQLRTPARIRVEVPPEEVRELFRAVIQQRIPVGEHVDFVFMFENVSVSWREQAVRHRIGVNPSPERLGADFVEVDRIPDLSDSSWWSQSMRIQNMGKFAHHRSYRMPESILKHPDGGRLLSIFEGTMQGIEDAYNELVRAGIPMEDARELIPLGAQHRISWRLNIGALQHIVGKRGCWILQLGIWGPVIEGMIRELVEKVDPIFGELVTPPCLRGDDFTGCVYMEENRRRYTGDDAHPPCPLHLVHHYAPSSLEGEDVNDAGVDKLLRTGSAVDLDALGVPVPMLYEMRSRAEEYRKFWGRDPYTGRRLPVLPST